MGGIIHYLTPYLQDAVLEAFNQQKADADCGQLKDGDYRGLDLRNLDVDGLDLTNGYFRNADIRGLDFRNTTLEGASICDAKISGCYFPKSLTAAEIRMSLEFGTRLRCRG